MTMKSNKRKRNSSESKVITNFVKIEEISHSNKNYLFYFK